MSILGIPLTFLNPFVLAALLLLPVLWFLLRILPPAPKRIHFAPAFLMAGLRPQTATTDKTPLWILLLRMAILALLILALSAPVLNPNARWQGERALLLILDNSWPSAVNRDRQMEEARRLSSMAAQPGRISTLPQQQTSCFKTHPCLSGLWPQKSKPSV